MKRASTSEKAEWEKRQVLTALLDQLDARDATEAGRCERRSIRAAYRRFGVKTIVHHPGGTSTERHVLTRDLSAGGLSFIHNGYLHVGTRCDVILARYVGGEDTVHGQVTHCSHISGTWHTVGIKFDRKIFPRLYLDPQQSTGIDLDPHNPQNLRGRVLLVDGSELDRRLIAHQIRNTHIELTSVPTLSEAISALEAHKDEDAYDLAIVDLNVGGGEPAMAATEVVSRIIQSATAVAVCSAETNASILAQVEALPIKGLLRKPYDAETLLGSLSNWLGAGNMGDGELIHSSLAGQPDMASLLAEFVENVRKLGNALEAAVQQNQIERCRAICVTLRGSGSGYGFSLVTEVAGEAVRMLEATSSVAKSAAGIQRLQDICARVTDKRADEPSESAGKPVDRAA